MSDLVDRQSQAAAVVADNLELLARHLREHPHTLRGLNIRRDISPPGCTGDIYIEETEYLVRVFGAPDIEISDTAPNGSVPKSVERLERESTYGRY